MRGRDCEFIYHNPFTKRSLLIIADHVVRALHGAVAQRLIAAVSRTAAATGIAASRTTARCRCQSAQLLSGKLGKARAIIIAAAITTTVSTAIAATVTQQA